MRKSTNTLTPAQVYRYAVETCQADSTSSDGWCGTPGGGYDRRRRAA